MNPKRWFSAGLILLVCVLASPAQASPHGHAMEHSPFVKKEGGHGLHCALMGHDIQQPCPHYQKRGSGDMEFTLPCHDDTSPVSAGGGPASTAFLLATAPGDIVYDPASGLSFTVSSDAFSLSLPLKHPPRFLSENDSILSRTISHFNFSQATHLPLA